MNKPKLLITGAGGYIGSIATQILLEKGYDIVALDNFSKGYRQPLMLLQKKYGKKKLAILALDLNADLNPLFAKHKDLAGIIHFAALCDVDESFRQPQQYTLNNVRGTSNLLQHMKKYDIGNIVFSSTCAVYGAKHVKPVTEKAHTGPASPYARSKLQAEHLIEKFGKRYHKNYSILRYFNVTGAATDGELGDSKKPSTLLVQNAVRAALSIEPLTLTCAQVDTPDGTPIRDYVDVVDLVTAHCLALEKMLTTKKFQQIINIGTGKGNSVLDIVTQVQKITDVQLNLKKSPKPRKGESPKVIASIKKSNTILKFKPVRSLSDSIRSMQLWYTKNPNGWRK